MQGGGLFFSQDDSYEGGCTPRDQSSHRNENMMTNSPHNRKKRGRFFAIFGKSNAENVEIEPSHFIMSQDDSNQRSLSQFSHDFTERLGGLSMKASQDQFNYSDDSRSNFSTDGNLNLFGSNSNSSMANRNSKFVPFSTMKAPQQSQSRFSTNREVPLFSIASKRPSSSSEGQGQGHGHAASSSSSGCGTTTNGSASGTLPIECSQKQIIIPPAIDNPFNRDNGGNSKDLNHSKLRRKPV